MYEHADIVIVDKPAGVVVHPGAGQPDQTLVNGLLHRYPELESVGETHRPGIVHRLDRGTSGLLVVARSPRLSCSEGGAGGGSVTEEPAAAEAAEAPARGVAAALHA